MILAGLAALVGVALLLDGEYLRRALRYVAENPLALTAAFGAYTGAFALRALAWRPLIPCPIPRLRLLSLLLAALFLNHVAPGKAGDFARMYGISKRGVSGAEAAASVVLARLADLVGLLVVLTGAWALTGGAQWGAGHRSRRRDSHDGTRALEPSPAAEDTEARAANETCREAPGGPARDQASGSSHGLSLGDPGVGA